MHLRRLIVSDAAGDVADLTSACVRDPVDIDALKRGEKKYLWPVGALGRLFIGEEEPAGADPETGKERHRGQGRVLHSAMNRTSSAYGVPTGQVYGADRASAAHGGKHCGSLHCGMPDAPTRPDSCSLR